MFEAAKVTPTISQMVPGAFFEAHREEVAAAMLRVVDSGWYILGQEVAAFEREFSDYFGFGGAVGVASGTDAIVLALRTLGIGFGDRVATVSHTAVATVAAIEMTGASPVFVDVAPDTYLLDPASLERTLGEVDSIRAIIAVHLYGHAADVPTIASIAKAHGIPVIEDCSQAHGARLNGFFAGSMADIGTFSFYPTKNLGALGDGGMVVFRHAEDLKRGRSLREYGWERRYISEVPGMNTRLDELQAAILRFRLPYLDAGNQRRRQIAAAYNDGLRHTGLMLPREQAGATHVYHQYVVRDTNRGHLQRLLKERGIGTNIHYPVPVHLQPAYENRCCADPAGLRATELVANEILSLPMYPELTDADVASVIDIVCNCTEK